MTTLVSIPQDHSTKQRPSDDTPEPQLPPIDDTPEPQLPPSDDDPEPQLPPSDYTLTSTTTQ